MHYKLQFWQFILKKIQEKKAIALLLIPESVGSSPGRQGHQMAIATDGAMFGTIGGGGMEYKVVEQRKKDLADHSKSTIYECLVHDPSQKEKGNWSGLSCSGQQTILSYFFDESHYSFIQEIIAACRLGNSHFLVATPKGLVLEKAKDLNQRISWNFESETDWEYRLLVGFRDTVYIVGAGHVGLALCQQMALLDFQVILLDNRPKLQHPEFDTFIDKKELIKYKDVADYVPSTVHDYIVIMTFSSALDSLVVSKLLTKDCKYIGLMASKTKATRINQQMLEKGFSQTQFDQLHTPIGIPIRCKSPAEIAVSVAAQIINIRNAKR